ncbi:MAG: hypothetical protein C5B47_06860, partial [Verrucomicrobia bacterium]
MPQISYSNNGNFLRTAIQQRELAQQTSSGTTPENRDHADDNLSDSEKEALQERQRVRRHTFTKVLGGLGNIFSVGGGGGGRGRGGSGGSISVDIGIRVVPAGGGLPMPAPRSGSGEGEKLLKRREEQEQRELDKQKRQEQAQLEEQRRQGEARREREKQERLNQKIDQAVRESVRLGYTVKMTEIAQQEGWVNVPWWQQWYDQWQREEKQFEAIARTEFSQLVQEFQQRNETMVRENGGQHIWLGDRESYDREVQWRENKFSEMVRKLNAIGDQTRQRLMDLSLQLEGENARGQLGTRINAWEQMTVGNKADWSKVPWGPQWHSEWQKEEEDFQAIIQRETQQLKQEFEKRNATMLVRVEGQILWHGDRSYQENGWRSRKIAEVTQKLNTIREQKRSRLINLSSQQYENKLVRLVEVKTKEIEKIRIIDEQAFTEKAVKEGWTKAEWWAQWISEWQKAEKELNAIAKEGAEDLAQRLRWRDRHIFLPDTSVNDAGEVEFTPVETLRNEQIQARQAAFDEIAQALTEAAEQKRQELMQQLVKLEREQWARQQAEKEAKLAEAEAERIAQEQRAQAEKAAQALRKVSEPERTVPLPEKAAQTIDFSRLQRVSTEIKAIAGPPKEDAAQQTPLITKITDPYSISQQWYAEGDTSPGAYPRSLKQHTDERGLVSQFKYDTKGNLTEKTVIGDLTGEGASKTAVTQFRYNDNNLLTSVVDPVGNICEIRNTYSAVEGKLVQKQQIAAESADEINVEYTYNAQGLLISQRRIMGKSIPDVITEFEYNSSGELTKQIDDSGIFTYLHDP